MSAPWTFDEAVKASEDARSEQERVEGEIKLAYRDHAVKERVYYVALARRIWELKRDGIAITACATLAKGDPVIAALREEAHSAEGLKETAKAATWRANADRKDVEALLTWSMRRDLAEGNA